MLYIALSILITSFLIAIAANLNAKMDRMMINYMDLSDNQKTLEYYKLFPPGWYSFDWRAKYENLQSGKRAYNVLLLKIGIKTRRLSDNCNDAWHFYKSVMINLFVLCMFFQGFITFFYNGTITQLIILKSIEFCIFGSVWNVFFNNTLRKQKTNN